MTKPRYKHHRKIPREDDDDDDDYSDASLSQPPYQSNEDDEEEEENEEYQRPVKEYDDDIGSESEPSDRISSQSRHDYNIIAKSLSNSPATQLSSYMNIAPLPIFRGAPNESPVTHLSRFAKVCRANNASTIDMVMRIFPVTLEDEAALWYDLNVEPYLPSLNWEDVKSSFLHAYQKIELVDRLRSELMAINQGDEESVRSYFLRLQWILNQWPDHGLGDGLLKGVFVDGLREDFRDRIVPHKPNSLNEALRLAFEFEQVQSIRPVRKRAALKCGFCDGVHEELGDCEVRESMRELWRKNKEEEINWSDDDEVGKAFVRSVSIGAGKNGGDDGKEEGGKKKSRCQCWKHQCWKKKLDRNSSFVTTANSKAETEM